METAKTLKLDSQICFHNKNIAVNKCVKCNSVLSIYFPSQSINFNITDVLLKNIKTRAEFSCKYILIQSNLLILDLCDLDEFFTDYEAEIVILSKTPSQHITITPLVSTKNILLEDSQEVNDDYKWYIRVTENNIIRLSTIINKL